MRRTIKLKKSKSKRRTLYDKKICGTARELCALFGATEDELAKFFNITKRVVRYWAYTHPEFKKAIQDGKDQFDVAKVETSLKLRAVGREYEEVSTEDVVLKNKVNNSVLELPGTKIKKTKKLIPGDVTAQIFWLVNRSKHNGRWVNLYNIQVSGADNGPVKHEISKDMNSNDATNIYMGLLNNLKTDLKKGKKDA